MTTQDSVDYHAELFNRVSYFSVLCVCCLFHFVLISFRTGVSKTRRSNLNKFLQTTRQHASEGTQYFLILKNLKKQPRYFILLLIVLN
jgi:hypothetical protein